MRLASEAWLFSQISRKLGDVNDREPVLFSVPHAKTGKRERQSIKRKFIFVKFREERISGFIVLK